MSKQLKSSTEIDKKITALIKRIKLDCLETWADCWRDDDSPQAERTFGVRS